jgi:uncharacterized protein (TIGR03437 family)
MGTSRLVKAIFLLAVPGCATVAAQPVITSIVNNATYAPDQPLAPRGIVAVFGQNLTDGTSCLPPSCGPVLEGPSTLRIWMAGSAIYFDYKPATILYATPTQLGVQLPADLKPGRVRVQLNGTGVAFFSVDIAASAPGIFTQNQQGTGAGAILHANGTPVTETDPAAAGETVVMYGTGFGQTSPALASGQVPGLLSPGQSYSIAAPLQLLVGGVPAKIVYAGASPCCAGLDQVNFEIPQQTGSGSAISVVLAKSGSSRPISIAVRGAATARQVVSVACAASGLSMSCTVTLDGPAGADGAVVWLKSANSAFALPETITVPAGQSSVRFAVETGMPVAAFSAQVDAVLNGTARTTATVPAALNLSWVTMGPVGVKGGMGESTSGKLQAFAMAASNPNILYAGGGLGPGNEGPLTHAGAFRSDDAGRTWKQINAGLSDSIVNTLWVDPSDANVALAGTEFTGMYRTTDGGAHWKLVGDFPGVCDIEAWKGELIAGSSKGIIHSTDAGVTWSLMYATDEAVRTLSVSGTTLLAGTEWGHILAKRSGDDRPVTVYTDTMRTVWSVAVDPADASNMFAVLGYNPAPFLRSRDGGKTWIEIHLPNGATPQGIAYSASPHVLYAVGGGAFKSLDNGNTWSAIDGAGWDVRRPFPIPGTNALVLGTDQGLHRSDDGRTWRPLSGNVGNYILTGLAVSGKKMVAAVQDFSGFSTQDGGATWVQPSPSGMTAPGGECGSALFHPTDSRYCYAYTTGGIQYSNDGCKTFHSSTSPGLEGVSYEQPGGTQILAVDPVHPEVVYAATTRGIYRSRDYGVNFTSAGWGIQNTTAIAIDPVDANIIYVASQSGLYRSSNGGGQWSKVVLTQSTTFSYPTSIAINAKNPSIVIVGLSQSPQFLDGGVLRSTDRGNTFQFANRGLPTNWHSSVCCTLAVMSVRFQPGTVAGVPLVALATDYGLFLSTDLGQSWQDARANAIPMFFSDLAWDGGYLYVSTFGQGVLRSSTPLALPVN